MIEVRNLYKLFGAQTAVDLANAFGSIGKLQRASLEDLMDIDGVGTVVAESILAWFADPDNEQLLKKFEDLGVKTHFKKASGKLAGQNFVVTGTLETMSREEAADRIRALGGIFQTSVAKDTTYLVVGGKVGASKLKKAQSYGIKIINEQELIALIG